MYIHEMHLKLSSHLPPFPPGRVAEAKQQQQPGKFSYISDTFKLFTLLCFPFDLRINIALRIVKMNFTPHKSSECFMDVKSLRKKKSSGEMEWRKSDPLGLKWLLEREKNLFLSCIVTLFFNL